MIEFVNPRLAAWENYYVIVGGAAAALISVQFVVIALISNRRLLVSEETINAFGTPTVVHLGGALIVSAIMCAPFASVVPVSVALALCGLSGLVYVAIVIRRTRRQKTYKPVAEDWLWHAILPCAIYAALTLAALFLDPARRMPPFLIGGAALILLLVGIHNAWDSVTHHVTQDVAKSAKDDD
jgi:hypothetical protein